MAHGGRRQHWCQGLSCAIMAARPCRVSHHTGGSGWGPRRANQDSGAWMGPWESKTQVKGAPWGGSRWAPGRFS